MNPIDKERQIENIHNKIQQQKMRIHYFQHESFEGLGIIEEWAKSKGHSLTSTKFYQNFEFPVLDDFDFLIVMGGPMGVYEENKYHWLKEEKEFIRMAIDKGKIILGICLGAQLIAAALGSKVYPNKQKEIGWLPISLSPKAKEIPIFSSFPPTLTVFQWHGDTFDLPEGAELIASSEVCLRQAFLYKQKVLALQFHFEVTKESVLEMIENADIEQAVSTWIQSVDQITKKSHLAKEVNPYMVSILEGLTRS